MGRGGVSRVVICQRGIVTLYKWLDNKAINHSFLTGFGIFHIGNENGFRLAAYLNIAVVTSPVVPDMASGPACLGAQQGLSRTAG